MRSSKPTCNISLRLLPSIWFAAWHGSVAFLALRLGVLLLLACMRLHRRLRQRYHFP
jgi:hypothetical protein